MLPARDSWRVNTVHVSSFILISILRGQPRTPPSGDNLGALDYRLKRIFSHEFPGHLISIGGKACLVLTRLVSMHLSQSFSAMVAALLTNMSSLPNVSRVLLITAESKIAYIIMKQGLVSIVGHEWYIIA